jgi:extradiol dioxygenase family protein
MPWSPFHLAIPVSDLAAARGFYGDLLGCAEGRSTSSWIDFDFFGHQLVCHLVPAERPPTRQTNPVDGKQVPIPHFGLVLEMAQWQRLAAHLKAQQVEFVIEPSIRFKGEPGEQATMFLHDPSGNAIEFKAFQDIAKQLFET